MAQTREPTVDSASDEPVRDAGGPFSFDQYITVRGAALLRLAVLLTGDVQRAEDLVQDTLARAYLRWDSIHRVDDPDVYLRRMLINACRSWWRKRSNREVPVERTADQPAPGDFSAELAERDAVRRLIATLSHRQRAVLVLRYYEDLDDATIAQILDCAEVTVRTHALRALTTLRQRYASFAVRREAASREQRSKP